MSEIIERLQYIAEQHTQAWIVQNTDIPQSTLSYVLRGLRELPEKYFTSANNLYQKEVVSRLTAQGLPYQLATELMNNDVAEARSRFSWLQLIASRATISALAAQAVRDDEILNQDYIDENFSSIYSSILENMQASEKPLTEWDTYVWDAYQVV